MSTATTARTAGTVPASRESADQAPDRVPRGEPYGFTDGLPVYRWGQAPAYLQTQTQLGQARLKLADGQPVLAYLYLRKHDLEVPLYDPAAAVKMRPLSSTVKKRMEAARTCPECGKVREHRLNGRPCSQCWHKAQLARQRERARTCWGCGTVRERPYPVAHNRCGDCRRAQLAEERARKAEAVLYSITCPGRDCSVKTATKAAVRRWREANPYGYWRPRWCSPCEERDARERAEAERRAVEAREAEREARRRRVLELQEWAAAALANEALVVLDTETTGLDADACVVELAVISGSGDVLVDTLVNPGRPIPAGASEIHGITDEAVATAPSFGQILVGLTAALDGRRCLIWNAPYDKGVLRWELTRHYRAAGHEDPAASAAAWLDGMTLEDAMVPYSDWYGDWSDYWGNYSWQALGGGHRALGDVRAVLDRLREMAAPVASSVD
ncbi:3'-5' exonuclease [Streptomyces virginiae]|uniref:3'-5' exonuclease n=1 Tax=Streptomyces virginiae TaxID=1961 RepID=UPI001FCBE650|nr:3'-5' exonuclease [Streptomyces virginiae]